MKRDVNLDLLRIIASFMVIFLHVSAKELYSYSDNLSWQFLAFYDSLVRSCVPLFVMLSGILFLNIDKKVSPKQIWQKNIFKLLFIYFVWSFMYALIALNNYQDIFSLYNLKKIILLTINSSYHLWYIPMLIILYSLTPIIKEYLKKIKPAHIEYFLKVWLVFLIIIPSIRSLNITNISAFNTLLNKFDFGMIFLYIGYYILGYYLYFTEYLKEKRKMIYMLAVSSVMLSYIMTSLASNYIDGLYTGFWGYNHVFTMIEGVGIFLFFKYYIKIYDFKIISNLSKYTLGIYLIHVAIIKLFSTYILTVKSFSPILSVPTIAFSVFVCSLILVYLIKKIPYLNRWLV